MRVLVYTVSFGNVPDYVKASVEVNTKYCESHGYEFREFILPEDFERNPAWGRVWFLKENIQDYDYMLYIDGDAFVVNHAMSLLSYIEYMNSPDVCGLFARDQLLKNRVFHHDRPNAGVFLFSRQNNGKQVAEEWWNVPNDESYTETIYDSLRYLSAENSLQHHPYEQLALWFLWERKPLSFRFVKSYRDLNGLDGLFVRHLIKVPDTERSRIINAYLKSMK